MLSPATSIKSVLRIERFRMCVKGSLDVAFMAAGRQTTVLISSCLPENHRGGSLKSKHPCQGGETGRDGRDRFLCFRTEKNNDGVS